MNSDKKINLLMVDDEVKFIKVMTDRLKLKYFEITSATNGADAINYANNAQFDVAIIDLRMPGMDGIEVLKTLKSNHKFLEVIILSGHATIGAAVECTKLGAYKILEKPCELDTLVTTIKEAYESRLKKKFKHDQQRIKAIEALALGQSPLGILRELSKMDDAEK